MTDERAYLQTPYPVIAKFCEFTGYSVKAVEKKIETGVWLEGREYHRAPDGRLLMDIDGFNRWVRGERTLG
jgi:hypothetical protein